MKEINTLVFTLLFLGIFQSAFAQVENSSANLGYTMTDEENIILFGGFALAVVAIFLFLARDAILRRKALPVFLWRNAGRFTILMPKLANCIDLTVLQN